MNTSNFKNYLSVQMKIYWIHVSLFVRLFSMEEI